MATTEKTFPVEFRPAADSVVMLEAELRGRIAGEVRFDRTSRMLYSTDASNYQIEPVGVVIPRTNDDVQAAVELASKHGITILPRGGGSSLAGQAVGPSLVIDFSKYMNAVLEINPEERTARVQPGLNLARFNAQIRQHGLMFGPDPSSGDRATIGGVVGNNSSGAHSILYGMTGDHVQKINLLLPDGNPVTLEPGTLDIANINTAGGRLMTRLLDFQEKHSELIKRDFPRHWRRATGYSLNYFLDEQFNPAKVVVSSEGTLATTLDVTVGLVPTPRMTALALLQFDDLVEAMAATTTILETEPSAIELMDRLLIELTRQQPGFARQIAFIKGSPEAVLAVEYYGDTDGELRAQVERLEKHLHDRGIRARDPESLRSHPAGGRLVGAQGRPGSADEHPRRRQADPGHRGRLGAGRAPGRVRGRDQASLRAARHARRLLRPRQRGLPAHSPADQPERSQRHPIYGRDHPLGGRSRLPLRRRDERRARRRLAALRAQRADLR